MPTTSKQETLLSVIKPPKIKKFSLLTLSFLGIIGTTQIAQASIVHNYGENLTSLKKAYQNKNLHILQIGDSHTAGDYFTEKLRKRLQSDIGDGGVGFAYPARLKGQRSARHGYRSSWSTTNSKRHKWTNNYPLGGVFASPSNANKKLTLTSKYYRGDTQAADVVVYGQRGQQLTFSNRSGVNSVTLNGDGWQTVRYPITFPTSLQAEPNMKVGGFWLSRSRGGVVSSMGINGATQDYWRRWKTDIAKSLSFSQADLVILSYGTNEAFRSSGKGLTTHMNRAINNIRKGLPHATILIVGAPESLSKTHGSCGKRSPSLDSVQYQLQKIAKQNRTLYWDWQEVMGGTCSMKRWVDKKLAARDGVHFSRSGYDKAANDLYNNLKIALKKNNTTFTPRATPNANYGRNSSTYTPKYNYTIDASKYPELLEPHTNSKKLNNGGSGQICDQDGNCRQFN